MFSKIFAEIWRKNSAKQYDSKIKMQKKSYNSTTDYQSADYKLLKKVNQRFLSQ